MIFSSNIFLFAFLPLFLLAYYLTPAKMRSLTILVGSYIFYAWWRVDFLFLFVAVTTWNYFIGLRIATNEDDLKRRKGWLLTGVSANLATLAYFKYANFGAETINQTMSSLGLDPWLVSNVILPIGISFYIFQAISYLIDVYRKDVEANDNFIEFAAFIALFPQLIAGPVLRYKDIAHQFRGRTHTVEKFSEGAQRFMLGFIKKVVIADTLAPIVNAGFALENPSQFDAWITTIAYAAQLYFDFSGYADMAIGLGLMMGFRFIENFNQPYISQSITEFWRRWHISLSTWLRDYLYIPLGGNRNGKLNTYRNLFLTMILGGFWHGANWTFIVWGAWHGSLLAIEKALGLKDPVRFNVLRWSFTLFLVMLGWVVFRADSLSSAWGIYSAMFDFSSSAISNEYAVHLSSMQIFTLCFAWVWIVVRGFGLTLTSMGNFGLRLAQVSLVPCFALAILKLSAQSYSAFLYFQF